MIPEHISPLFLMSLIDLILPDSAMPTSVPRQSHARPEHWLYPFRAGGFARHHIIRFSRNAARHFCPRCFEQRFGRITRERRQSTGQYHGFSGKRTVSRLLRQFVPVHPR